MIHRAKTALIAIIGSSLLIAGTNQMKRYDIKSGKIDFKIIKSGNIMGMVQTKTVGKKRMVFDHFGAREIVEISQVTKETTGGKSKVRKEHTLTYLHEAIVYHVDFQRKVITRMQNPALAMSTVLGGGESLQQQGKAMLQKMGGKMIGKDKVLGYSCEVWDLMGVQQCIYRGVTLRVISDIMGIKSTEVATKITFNLSLDKEDFVLPDFPITDSTGQVLQIDRDDLDVMDIKESNSAAKSAEDAAKAMAAGMQALVKAGFDQQNPDAEITPVQEQAMQQAMMEAMGGEKAMFAKQKQEIMRSYQKVPQAKRCFQQANTVAEANACERALDSEEPEHHQAWSSRDKARVLKEITQFEAAMPCIKAAESFQALQQCIP